MVLDPLLISLPSERRLQVPSEPLTTVSFLASAAVALLPLTPRATTRHVPAIRWRSFLIASSLASSADATAATAAIAASEAPTTSRPREEWLMMDPQENRTDEGV